jgi:Tol biopolymer transport system component
MPGSSVRTLLGLALAVTALVAISAAPAPARSSASNYWILLTSDRDGTPRTYSASPDGSRMSPVLPDNHPLGPAAVTPDGRTIAYSSNDGLFVSQADGTGLRIVVAGRTDDAAFSSDGKLLVFTSKTAMWIARRDGSGLRRVAAGRVYEPALSPNGRLVAFTRAKKRGIWVVGTNGRDLRQLSTGRGDQAFAWSPDGKAIVFMRVLKASSERYAVVVRPMQGKERVLVRTGPNDDLAATADEFEPTWSPDGRWIAYQNFENAKRRQGLTLIRPNGTQRHRIVLGADDEAEWAWSPDGRWIAWKDTTELDQILPTGWWRKLSAHAAGMPVWSPDRKSFAFPTYVTPDKDVVREDIAVARADGSRVKQLKLVLRNTSDMAWSPDSRAIAVADGQIWVVGSDGAGLHRITNDGNNHVVGWTRLAPVLPQVGPLPPTERVISADTVETSTPVTALAADGNRVAIAPGPAETDCEHVVVWAPGADVISRLGPLRAPCTGGTPSITELALAGTRAGWVMFSGDDSYCEFALSSATLADPLALPLADDEIDGSDGCKPREIYHLRGHGDLLLANAGSSLVRIGAGTEKCGAAVCTTLRKDVAAPVDSVSAGLIATRKAGVVTVLDAQGRPVRSLAFTPADVYAARLAGERLVVARSYTIESYDIGSGLLTASQPLPAGYQLVDADAGVAVLRKATTIMLLRLGDGRSFTLTPGKAPVLADLEPTGLFYSYATSGGGGRVVFVPQDHVLRQLGGAL